MARVTGVASEEVSREQCVKQCFININIDSVMLRYGVDMDETTLGQVDMTNFLLVIRLLPVYHFFKLTHTCM